MAHGLNSVLKRGPTAVGCKSEGKTGIGSRRIFAPHFKLQVLDSYRNDADCKGNQRATARKYGIHRRQIQKWLQVENNLRNSISKGRTESERSTPEAALRSGRQQDDSPPAPLDFTTHSRTSPFFTSPDPAAPMDLSLKRPTLALGATHTSAPATYSPLSPPRVPSPPSLAQPHPDVWDLSTKRKFEESDSITNCAASKPIKLFKPYLDEGVYDEDRTKTEVPPCCSSSSSSSLICETPYYYNNNVCEIKSEYGNTYTLHELQPKNTCYYYTYPNYAEYEMTHFCGPYEDPNYPQSVPLKQRHSYSLDFKLSAIECYYQDSICKGNQRAVATKYNIHRRQVQKWLKQADELKQKNETIKQTQTVR